MGLECITMSTVGDSEVGFLLVWLKRCSDMWLKFCLRPLVKCQRFVWLVVELVSLGCHIDFVVELVGMLVELPSAGMIGSGALPLFKVVTKGKRTHTLTNTAQSKQIPLCLGAHTIDASLFCCDEGCVVVVVGPAVFAVGSTLRAPPGEATFGFGGRKFALEVDRTADVDIA